jgi:hypothetical protein
MVGWLVNNELEKNLEARCLGLIEVALRHVVQRTKNITKNLSQDIWCPIRSWNRAQPKYKSTATRPASWAEVSHVNKEIVACDQTHKNPNGTPDTWNRKRKNTSFWELNISRNRYAETVDEWSKTWNAESNL